MKTIRVYRSPDCARCAKFARVARFFDWRDRVDFSKETPRTGPLEMGEVLVEELSNGQIHRGAEGIELVWRNIPAYAPFALLLKLPSFRNVIERNVSGHRAHGTI